MYKRVAHDNYDYTIGKCYKATRGMQAIGNNGESVSASPEYFQLQPESPMLSMDPSSLELKVAAHIQQENQMDYQFSVSSDKLIDTYEISEGLTREHPMAIIHRSDGMHTVVLHDSIMQKLSVISKDLIRDLREAMEPYQMSPDDFVPTKGGCLTSIINAVRAVRNAKVLVGSPCTVKVVFPEI
jgi:hypothetical protein